MKTWMHGWLIVMSLLFPQMAVGKRIVVVFAVPSQYSNDTVGVTAFGNKPEPIELVQKHQRGRRL